MTRTVSTEMPRLYRPSTDEFRRFVENRVPVVIEGALGQWQAPSSWTLDRLEKLVGDVSVRVQSRAGPHADDFEYREVGFERFIESIRSGAGTDYLGSFPLLDRAPALWDDVGIPSYAGRLSVTPRAFIGPAGSFAPLHFDLAHGLSAQISGRKRVVVLAFRRRDVLGHRDLRKPGWLSQPLDVEAPEAAGQGGLVPVRRWECTLEPRDMLFLPSRRHHFLRSLDTTISLNFFWHTAPMRITRWILSRVWRSVT